mmetsp:Transcript_68809/g.149765  ORF Transcript_68809/g.149765 Transcript_68809/m.149765 type:complete len:128 (-) Transcript_68809:43-426(-)
MGLLDICQSVILLAIGLQSFRAIQSPNPSDDKHFLTFWLIFAIFEFICTVVDFIGLGLPLYSWLKLFVLLVLGLGPGAGTIYPFLEPYLLQADRVAAKYERRFLSARASAKAGAAPANAATAPATEK